MAGCPISNTRGNTAFVGFYRPTLFSPLQVANIARCMNPGEINYDRGAARRVAAVSSTILGAGLGLSVRYCDFMKNAVARRSCSRRALHDRLGLLNNSATPSSPRLAGIWLDYPPDYVPPKVDCYVDDGSFCFLSSPFTPASCSPLLSHKTDAVCVHTPTITSGSRSPSVTATAAAVSSPHLLPTSESGICFAGSRVNGTAKQARHLQSSCVVPVTMKAFEDRVPFGFLNLIDHSVAFASILCRVFVVTIAVVLCIVLHTLALVLGGRLRRHRIYELVMTLQGLQFPFLQKDELAEPALEVAAVGDGDYPCPSIEATSKDVIPNSPAYDAANDIVQTVEQNTHSNVSDSNFPSSTSIISSSPSGGVLTVKQAFDDAIEAHIRSVEAQALAAMEDEDYIDKHIRAVEARALLPMASLNHVAPAFVPKTVCNNAAPKKTHRRRRRRVRRRRNKNHVAAIDIDFIADGAGDADSNSDESDEVESASESSFSDDKEPDTLTSSAPFEGVDEPKLEQCRKKKRRQRGRNRGRGPRNQQLLFEPDEDDDAVPNWAAL